MAIDSIPTPAMPPLKAYKIVLPKTRLDRLKLIKTLFPEHTGSDLGEDWLGGRTEALRRMAKIKPLSYAKNRNFLDGDVTRLSPYLRHGCITIAEAIHTTKKIANTGGAEKLLFEFAWRDYWRKVWYTQGQAIDSDMEPAKVQLTRQGLANDILEGESGLACMDHFVSKLTQTGYLHNHARMWLASYLVHWRGVDWKVGALWMQSLLLDGDQASSNLSWQWVASTFGSKPYFFNKENLSKYSDNQFCRECKAQCPFDKSYDTLSTQLFKPSSAPAKQYKKIPIRKFEQTLGNKTIVLFHDEMLSIEHPLYRNAHQKIFVFDPKIHEGWAINRLQFMADCLIEMSDVEVWQGSLAAVLASLDVAIVITQDTPNLLLKSNLNGYVVDYWPELEPYAESVAKKLQVHDLKRFSKYWHKVGQEILKPLD